MNTEALPDTAAEAGETNFAGRKALVIGGSGGIGRAVSALLAEKGAFVTVHGGSSRQRLEETLDEIKAAGGKAKGFLCRADETGAAERIFSLSPNPDILVCAWGPFERRSFGEMDGNFWERMSVSNLAFPGTVVSLAIRGMLKKNWGRILLFGGTNTDTIRGYTTTVAYSAAKTALGVIAKSAARAGAGNGVTCNVLCPGLTDTEYLDAETRSYNRERSPGGRALAAKELARMALAILENPALSGAVIPMDSGIVI